MKEKQYDSQQQLAINAQGGYYLVLAPPGCGKTDILSERIYQAINNGVNYDDILCLTFTNRASRGMKNRVQEKIGSDANNIFVGNVHRFCSNFLYSYSLIPENTCIIDEDDLTDILMSFDDHYFLTRSQKVDKMKIKAINDIESYIRQKRLGHPESSLFVPAEFDQYYQVALKAGFDPELVPSDKLSVRYALMYGEYKERRGHIDFSDILILAYDYLRKDVDKEYKRYSWIQVDEVQDLNALQTAIIDELTDKEKDFTVMYLGDEQQAIFSFLGAKLGQLSVLKNRCGKERILTLGNNYRSPKYLLDVFNTYAEKELGVDKDILPQSTRQPEHEQFDLILTGNQNPVLEQERVSKMVKYYLGLGDEERLAILVATNQAADEISAKLTKEGVANFKISGTDMFKSVAYKTLSSFFCVLANEFNTLAWARLLFGIRAVRSLMSARDFVAKLRSLMMTPTDLFTEKSYIEDFNERYENEEFVFFDTETTGLNVLEDDIVQIAAFKVYRGEKVPDSDFVIFIHTDKEIPAKLGTIDNPLLEAYANNPHYSKEEGLRKFIEYIGDDPILGHNVNYDYRILQSNTERYLHETVTYDIYDSLKLIKCVEPKLRMYKLVFLLKELQLEGKNSHLADEDITATKALVDYCYNKSKSIIPEQKSFMSRVKVQNVRDTLQVLEPLFMNVQDHLYLPIQTTLRTIADEFKTVYDEMYGQALIECIGTKFEIFLQYMQNEWVDPYKEESLFDQILTHVNDMTSTINEGDLVNSEELMTDRVFIMTVYKGKGLEFDNVVVLGANEGTYPFYMVNQVLGSCYSSEKDKAQALQDRLEDARKFYVAISRAKKRLCVSYTDYNAWGRPSGVTPFMNSIQKYFYCH